MLTARVYVSLKPAVNAPPGQTQGYRIWILRCSV